MVSVNRPPFGAIPCSICGHGPALCGCWDDVDEEDDPVSTTTDPELTRACPTCSAPIGEDCKGFGYCPARIDAAAALGVQPGQDH